MFVYSLSLRSLLFSILDGHRGSSFLSFFYVSFTALYVMFPLLVDEDVDERRFSFPCDIVITLDEEQWERRIKMSRIGFFFV